MSRNTVILIIISILVLAAAAFLLFGKSDTESAITSTNASVSAAEQTFINLTAQLSPVAFNTSILSDARFMALIDLKTVIVPEVSGRLDPFAPLPGVPVK